MRIKTTLLAAAAGLAISPAAHAYEGLYGAIGAGLNYMGYENDVSNDSVGAPGPVVFDSSADYDNGIGVYAALGYDTGNWRGELEYSYRSNDLDQIDPDGAGFSGWPAGYIGGDTTTHGVLFNLIYDFNKSDSFTPYLGAGVGLGFIDPDITGSVSPGAPTTPLSIAYSGSNKATLAYQGIAGVSIGLAQGLALDLSYRYFSTLKETYTATINGAPGNVKLENASHTAFAGLRWDFAPDQAAPVAPQFKDCWDGSSVPVTAECPPQVVEQQAADLDPINFTVYFDYDKSNLTSQASDLIREAASRALENDIDTVVVAGNTDTSGGSAYNQALSERRARVVRDGLIANGVPADRIRLEAYGENNLAKPTADGVREPLNRRADVVISFE